MMFMSNTVQTTDIYLNIFFVITNYGFVLEKCLLLKETLSGSGTEKIFKGRFFGGLKDI